jgi:arylformamidase
MTNQRRGLLIDLSHTIEDGMITYPGLPGPVIGEHLSREDSRTRYREGTEFQIGKIELVGNTGTYLDSPFHRYAAGKDLSDLPLDSLADLDAVVVRPDITRSRAIEAESFSGTDLLGRAVLIDSGWSKHWRTPQYCLGHPDLTEDAARFLAKAGARLVGIDSPNIDSTDDGSRQVHTILLGADIPVVEHLCNPDQAPDSGFRFLAVPSKIRSFASLPRASLRHPQGRNCLTYRFAGSNDEL